MAGSPGSSSSDSDVVDETPKTEPIKAKGKKKCRAKKVLAAFRNLFTPRPRLGMMANRVEQLPPTTPGNYTRWVNTVDGTISYIKTKPLVSMPAEKLAAIKFTVTVPHNCLSTYLAITLMLLVNVTHISMLSCHARI